MSRTSSLDLTHADAGDPEELNRILSGTGTGNRFVTGIAPQTPLTQQ
jgi:hypothetical protein